MNRRPFACDLRVAEETQQLAGYAKTLLALAELRSSAWESTLASTFGARRGSMLEARLRRLLAPGRSLPHSLRAAAGTAAGALLLFALVLCACKFQPSPKENRAWTPEEVRQRLQADPFPDGAG